MATKILTVGSALGSFSSLFTKVKAIDAKHGKFELLLCTGDFFGPLSDESSELDLLLEGKLDVPISTYITQGQHPIPPKVLAKTSPGGGEVCPNVFLLGKTSVTTTSHKLTIANFSGSFDHDTYLVDNGAEILDLSSSAFNSKNLETFLSSSMLPSNASSAQPSLASIKSSTSTSQIDILLTHGWPSSITRHSKTTPQLPEGPNWLVPPLDDVVKACRPRYHFAVAGGEPPVFWEREPFVWEEGQVSRFVSLGAFGDASDVPAGGKKPRWFYAVSMVPLTTSSPPLPRPANATSCPYPTVPTRSAKRTINDDTGGNFIFGDVKVKKPRLADQRSSYARQNTKTHEPTARPPEGYVCRKCQSTEHYIRDCPERNATGDTGGKRPPQGYVCRACASEGHFIQDCPNVKEKPWLGPVKEISPDECWFCLSNPRLTKHLIVSIGTEVYVTLPKGQLPPTDDKTPSPTSVPGGGHLLIIPISHYPTLSSIPSDLAPPILSELDTYKKALRTFYAAHGAVPVFFEVSRLTGKGGHAHVQVVPVPETKKGGVEEAFKAYGGQQVVWEDDPLRALTDAAGGAMNYFRVDLPDGRKMVHIIKPGRMFNLQFGREALGHFLSLTDRVDWKTCAQTDDEERRDALAFKNAFLEYDPSLL